MELAEKYKVSKDALALISQLLREDMITTALTVAQETIETLNQADGVTEASCALASKASPHSRDS